MRCIWCGSEETYLDHYRCWEEDEIGNAIEVQSEEEAEERNVTIQSVEYWCDGCDGYFGFQYVSDEEGDDVF